MAVNVTEKDKTLQEIIDWCKRLEDKCLWLSSVLLSRHEMAGEDVKNSHVKLAVPWEEPETETTKQIEDTNARETGYES